VLTGGAGGRAMSLAFQEVFGIADAFAGLPLSGRTDAWLLATAAQAHGIVPDPVTTARFESSYLTHLSREIERPGPRKGIMPGVRTLLDMLAARDDAHLALLTGNYEAGARLKLEYFDLWRYFRCGAFGDTVFDRNHLLPDAISRVRACGFSVVSSSHVVVIGDTPLDVACAQAGGARSIAVATGSHSVEDLRAAGADAAFETLVDIDAVLNEIWRGAEREGGPPLTDEDGPGRENRPAKAVAGPEGFSFRSGERRRRAGLSAILPA
jgi:phosphoglycolate phosphatase-like HAD superfamily hydrolase